MEHGCSQHRVGTCFDGGREVLDLAGTAGGDDRKSTLNVIGDEADDFRGAFAERSAGKAARFRAVGHALNAVASDGRVGGDHGVDAALDERVDATQDLFVFKIGGKLDSDGHVLAVAGVLELLAAGYDAGNKMVELVGALKLAKILRVGRGDIDSNIVCGVLNLVETLLVI